MKARDLFIGLFTIALLAQILSMLPEPPRTSL